MCELAIAQYSGRLIGDERLPLQIRYADTPAQKDLKRVTAERRQFRTNEYNVGAYGTSLVGEDPTNSHTYRRDGSGGNGGNGGSGGAYSRRSGSGEQAASLNGYSNEYDSRSWESNSWTIS